MADGDFVTEAQVNDLVTALVAGLLWRKNSPDVILDSSDDVWGAIEVQDDTTATAGWPNRFETFFKPDGETRQLVTWLNEYTELRLVPAKDNTVPLRIFGQNDTAPNLHSGWLLEIADNRVDRVTVFGVDQDGNVLIGGTVNGFPYHPIYAPGTTPATGDPSGLVVET